MSIVSGHKKCKKYEKLDDGTFKLISEWTHAETVYFEDGSTLLEALPWKIVIDDEAQTINFIDR